MKIIFLDIDGVLNCATTAEKIQQGIFTGFIGLDARMVKMFLDWLAAHPDIRIVISSTWRLNEHQLDLIREAGIDYIGITRSMANRATEIDDWLAAHPEVTAYAILDDIQQFNNHQRARFVKTSYEHGLRAKNLLAVEALLY